MFKLLHSETPRRSLAKVLVGAVGRDDHTVCWHLLTAHLPSPSTDPFSHMPLTYSCLRRHQCQSAWAGRCGKWLRPDKASRRKQKAKGMLTQWDTGREVREPVVVAAYLQSENLAQKPFARRMPLAVDRKKGSCSFSCVLRKMFPEAEDEGQICHW